jgi:hypothetical protein
VEWASGPGFGSRGALWRAWRPNPSRGVTRRLDGLRRDHNQCGRRAEHLHELGERVFGGRTRLNLPPCQDGSLHDRNAQIPAVRRRVSEGVKSTLLRRSP